MKKDWFKTITCVVVLFVSMCMGAMSVYSVVVHKQDKTAEPKYEVTSFAELYPYKEKKEKEADNQVKKDTTDHNKLVVVSGKIEKKVNKITTTIESYCNEKNTIIEPFYYIYGKTTKMLGKNMVEDAEENVYRLTNGGLIYNKKKNTDEIDWVFDNIARFTNYLEDRGIDCVHVITASKADEQFHAFPNGIESYVGENEKEYIKWLEKNNYDYLETKDLLLEENPDFLSWFYITDHHWTPEAALVVTKGIAEKLNDKCGTNMDISLLDASQYTRETYEDLFLGSQGKKTKLGYVDPEDFTILVPKFDTKLEVYAPYKGKNGEIGTMRETLIDDTKLEKDYYNINNYEAFCLGTTSYVKTINHNTNAKGKILVLKESKGDVIIPYLACIAKQVDVISPRYFGGSIETYVEKEKPDIVLTIFDPPYKSSKGNWDWR